MTTATNFTAFWLSTSSTNNYYTASTTVSGGNYVVRAYNKNCFAAQLGTTLKVFQIHTGNQTIS